MFRKSKVKRGIYYRLKLTEIQDLDKYNEANTLPIAKRINNSFMNDYLIQIIQISFISKFNSRI